MTNMQLLHTGAGGKSMTLTTLLPFNLVAKPQ